MNTVKLGKTGLEVTEIGLGGIPLTRMGMDEAVSLIRHCVSQGINFFDTAYMYGISQDMMGEGLLPVRKKVILATKSIKRDAGECEREFYESLEKLKTDYVDLFQFHNVSKDGEMEEILAPGGAYEFALKAKEKGQIRHIGFSSHHPDHAIACCQTGKFETVQFPFNFLEAEPGLRVFAAAEKQEMGLIGMKPLGGGLLNRADLCFRFLQSHPNVLPIPGIQDQKEIDEILALYRDRRPLDQKDEQDIQAFKDSLGTRFCNRCGYCMPCTVGIDIPRVMLFKTTGSNFPFEQVKPLYQEPMAQVDECIECGECLTKCPYELPIPEMLKECQALYQKAVAANK
jgi:hypothetical protein